MADGELLALAQYQTLVATAAHPQLPVFGNQLNTTAKNEGVP
jgi:hypothetical protein